ncbi:MAG: phosphate ABC transporter substrate-binding protein [Gammaproteobacteria bacterium]
MRSAVLPIIVAALLASTPAAAGVAVIAHPSVGIDSLTADEVMQLYMGRTGQLPDGTEVQPLDLGEGSRPRAEFIGRVLGRSEQQLRSYWSRMIFTGKARPPRRMNNTAEVLRTVATMPGYIGYVDVNDATSTKIKVLYRIE